MSLADLAQFFVASGIRQKCRGHHRHAPDAPLSRRRGAPFGVYGCRHLFGCCCIERRCIERRRGKRGLRQRCCSECCCCLCGGPETSRSRRARRHDRARSSLWLQLDRDRRGQLFQLRRRLLSARFPGEQCCVYRLSALRASERVEGRGKRRDRRVRKRTGYRTAGNLRQHLPGG